MSMNREEAINRIENHMEVHGIGEYPHIALKEALDMAITALRPVSREQVEDKLGLWVYCNDCCALGPTKDDEYEARLAWNTRAAVRAIRALEALDRKDDWEGVYVNHG